MAALEDLPWIDSMSSTSYSQDNGFRPDSQPPTIAAFSPTTLSGSSLTSRQRSSVIVHRKSPLLVATPPPVTRALAYSHPFILPLNKLVGLLTWTSGDPWQSFLLVASFWTVVLYSDAIILWAGPILVVVGLILGMYSRRYSPLSSTALTGEKHGHKKATSDTSTRHHKSLDEIVETVRTFTTRCNILLEPLLDLTDFLSTQLTATSATTKPALTALFVRILLITPIWILLTLPPFYIITTRRVVMTVGTIILTYHSQPARVSRVILWRSLTVRRICSMITGLNFSSDTGTDGTGRSANTQSHGHAMHISTRRRGDSSGVRFTFILYENQRRWLGLGWTYSLFPTERSAWTDEHLNTVPPKDEFELPNVQAGNAKWRWVEGSDWRIEGADDPNGKPDPKSSDGGGWIYYDNKWNDGRRGQDGWDRYTRRRKWYRDAELVEITPTGEEAAPAAEAVSNLTQALEKDANKHVDASTVDADTKSLAPSTSSKTRRRRWFGGSKGGDEKLSVASLPPTSDNSSLDLGKSTSFSGENQSGQSSSRPMSIHHSRKPSNFSGGVSHSSSFGKESGHGSGSIANSDSLSIRDIEMAQAQDHLDRWGARAAGGTERAEREWGLSDDVNMGLS